MIPDCRRALDSAETILLNAVEFEGAGRGSTETTLSRADEMKTKTTLAALLLAAVMVTPSYGATEWFLNGASTYLKDATDGYFQGYCAAVHDINDISLPKNATYKQLYTVVARYIVNHPEHHHLHNVKLIRRACKEAWPDENKHIIISK